MSDPRDETVVRCQSGGGGGGVVSVSVGVNRKLELKETLFLEKASFDSTFVLAAAGSNTQNPTGRRDVTDS